MVKKEIHIGIMIKKFALPHYTPAVSHTTPEATGLGKYVDITVSLYTGVPSISIPLYNINTAINIPYQVFNARYLYKGCKVHQFKIKIKT